ncbi:MAG: DUF309 domain-containing protein [Planctomycetota bacterium]|nr:DUF309 domain-containing protein [Planctomycetota bacterium]
MRYAPERAFPPYAFVPGESPHPTRDPRGHSYGGDEEPAAYLLPERWRENVDYLYGVDLYNHGYLWEAHEAWEGLWHAAKQDPLQADHLQGLIQCTAACLKIQMDQPRGLARLAQLGTEKLGRVALESGGTFMGLDLVAFAQALRAFADSAPESNETRPRIELG